MQDLKERLLYHSIRKAVISKGHKFFDNGQFNLNIIGIRRGINQDNLFDDLLAVLYQNEKYIFCVDIYNITTEPGRYWLEHPMTNRGAMIMAEGQYPGAYKLGKHKGYEALVQVKPIKVYRDNNKDSIIDLDPLTLEWGIQNANIHRSNPKGSSFLVDRWSGGCQVFQGFFKHRNHISVVKKSIKVWGNSFTYTLINEKDLI